MQATRQPVIARRSRFSPVLWGTGLILLVGVAWAAPVQATGLSVDGSIRWSARYPLGDAAALGSSAWTLAAAGAGQDSPNRLRLTQQVQLTLAGELLPGATMRADLSNARDDRLQLLAVEMERGPVRIRLGDQRIDSVNPFTVYNLSLKGLSLSYQDQDRGWQARLIAARWQGIPASRTFVGGWSTETLLLTGDGPPGPQRRDGELVAGLQGLVGARLDQRGYDPGFMSIYFQFVDRTAGPDQSGGPGPVGSSPAENLAQFLQRYGLGFLYQLAGGGPGDPGVMKAGDGVALGGAEAVVIAAHDYLLLRGLPTDLLRQQIQTFIRQYNEKNGLSGEQAQRYPFAVGSAAETAFLQELKDGHVRVRVGPSVDSPTLLMDRPLAALVPTGRFFDLAHGQVEATSARIELRLGGNWRPATEVPGFLANLWGPEGIIELALPAAFDVSRDAVRIQYRYAATRNVYSLGTSVLRGSERVYLNGRQLTRDKEYTFDEEAGLLVLLIEIHATDTLRVDYEYARGGLGTPTPSSYVRDLAGLTISYAPSPDRVQPTSRLWQLDQLTLEAWQSWDEPAPAAQQSRVATMPETLRLVGGSVGGQIGPVQLRLDAAASWDQFPPGDNRRLPCPNAVTALLRLQEGETRYLLLGDASGLHMQIAADGQLVRWRHYGTQYGAGFSQSAGLERVQALAASATALWIGSTAGLTRVARRSGAALGQSSGSELEQALGQPGSWSSWTSEQGFPAGGVDVLALGGGQVWAGTPAGLVQVEPAPQEGEAAPWRLWTQAEGLPSSRVTALAWDGMGVAGSGWADPANDPGIGPGTLWVGTDRGLAWLVSGQVQAHPVAALQGQMVTALALGPLGSGWQGLLVATDQGLWFLPAGGDPGVASAWYPVLPAAFVQGRAIVSLAVVANGGGPGQDRLFVGTTAGLWYLAEAGPSLAPSPDAARPVSATTGWTIRSLAGSGWDERTPELWVGSVARLPGTAQTPLPGERHVLAVWQGTLAGPDWSWQLLDGPSMGLSADDSQRYEDLSPEGHRWQGSAVALQLGQAGRWGEWQAQLRRTEPGFRSLGRTMGGDEFSWGWQASLHPAARWTVGAQLGSSQFGSSSGTETRLAGTTPASATAADGWVGDPWVRSTHGVTAGWTPGWAGEDGAIHVSYGQTQVDDRADGTVDRARTEWAAAWDQRLAAGTVAVQVDWELADSWDRSFAAGNYRGQQVTAGLQWRPSPLFRWSLNGTQPLAGGGAQGQGTQPYGWRTEAGWTLAWQIGWPGRLSGSAAASSWQRAADGATQRQLQASADLAWVGRRGLGLNWNPSAWVRLSASRPFVGLPRTSTAGQLTLRAAGAGGLKVQLDGGGWRDQYPTEERSVQLVGGRAQLSWPLAKGWQPTAGVGWSRLDWQNARYGRRQSEWAQGQVQLESPSWQGLGQARWNICTTVGFGWIKAQGGTDPAQAQPARSGYQAGVELVGAYPSGLSLTWGARWTQAEAVWAATAGAGTMGPGMGGSGPDLAWAGGWSAGTGFGLGQGWGAGAAGGAGLQPDVSTSRQASVESGLEVGYVWAARWRLSASLTWRQVWLRYPAPGVAQAWVPEVAVQATF